MLESRKHSKMLALMKRHSLRGAGFSSGAEAVTVRRLSQNGERVWLCASKNLNNNSIMISSLFYLKFDDGSYEVQLPGSRAIGIFFILLSLFQMRLLSYLGRRAHQRRRQSHVSREWRPGNVSLLSHVDATPNFVLPRARSCLVIIYTLILLVYSSVRCVREQ
jgi:hypothetical protein